MGSSLKGKKWSWKHYLVLAGFIYFLIPYKQPAEASNGVTPSKMLTATDTNRATAMARSDLLQRLKPCTTLECVASAHAAAKIKPRYNFPHFFIAGWHKCATSSLASYLEGHPDAVSSADKEPRFFNKWCRYNTSTCRARVQEAYLVREMLLHNYIAEEGNKAHFESTTHYAMDGPLLAQDIHTAFPYLKVVFVLREPISRAMSLLAFRAFPPPNTHDKFTAWDCLTEHSMVYCLYNGSEISGPKPDVQTKIHVEFGYTNPFLSWLAEYPAQQLHVIQYEELVDPNTNPKVIKSLLKFLELDEKKAQGVFPTKNSGIKKEGWPMTKGEYQGLIDLVQPDVMQVTGILQKKLGINAKQWMANWGTVWQTNLKSCGSDDMCHIQT